MLIVAELQALSRPPREIFPVFSVWWQLIYCLSNQQVHTRVNEHDLLFQVRFWNSYPLLYHQIDLVRSFITTTKKGRFSALPPRLLVWCWLTFDWLSQSRTWFVVTTWNNLTWNKHCWGLINPHWLVCYKYSNDNFDLSLFRIVSTWSLQVGRNFTRVWLPRELGCFSDTKNIINQQNKLIGTVYLEMKHVVPGYNFTASFGT